MEEEAAGDAHTEPPPPPPEPPKIPDVELIVDGFGFMPKAMQVAGGKKPSSVFEKTRKTVKEFTSPEDTSQKSPCASSTNLDIVRRYTWKTKNRMTVQVITYGATITSISVPDRKGVPDDIVAGFDTLEEYFQSRNPYFGAVIGRYANIIRDGTVVVRPSGRMYMLSSNKGHHHYNGGYVGFDKVNWRSYVVGNKVIMSHVSERFHEGYPGTVLAQVSFEVTCDNSIKIEMKCTTSEPTVVNLSNTPYFNLAGHHAGCEMTYDHIFTINADKYTVTSDDGIVTGEKKVVGGTPFDFRVPRVLRAMLPRIPQGGFDLNYCITQGTEQDLAFQARVLHPGTGRVLEVYSNQPGMQFYTGNLLPDPDKILEVSADAEEGRKADEASEEASDESEEEENGSEGRKSFGYVPLLGKGGTYYKKHGLFCLMPQNYPDAANHCKMETPVVAAHRVSKERELARRLCTPPPLPARAPRPPMKHALSPAQAECLRAIFAALLWHEGYSLREQSYYGSLARCEADANGAWDPVELVCGACSDVAGSKICPKHGSDFFKYECRYCCSVAVYFCFGTSHFCNACHDDFQRVTNIPRDQLPQCPTGPKCVQLPNTAEQCPLLVSHPPTGDEFALGCGICQHTKVF